MLHYEENTNKLNTEIKTQINDLQLLADIKDSQEIHEQ